MRLLLSRCALLVSLALCTACAASENESSGQVAGRRADLTVNLPGTQVAFQMLWIPAGGFWMGRTEVTWDEYLVFCAFNQQLPEGVDALTRPSKPLEVYPHDRHWGTGQRPAVGMSRNGAERYCAWLSERLPGNYRLPTEEEWATACGPRPSELRTHAWTAANSGGKTQPVGLKRPNANRLHDMLGNLWEYCGNPYSADEPQRSVLRGGSWREAASLVQPQARLRFEDEWLLDDPGFPPGLWWVPDGDHLGFRVIRVPESSGV